MIAVGMLLAGCGGLERHEPPVGGRGEGADSGSAWIDTGSAAAEIVGEACYPGAVEDFATCLGVVGRASPPEDYVYPPPLEGSAQYAEPTAFLDLGAADPFVAIAPAFLLGEVADAADGAYAVVQVHAIVALQAVRDRVGALMVTSGYRSPAHNAFVGGATWSRHMYGDAFDLVPLYATLDELADACWDEGASYVEVYATHVHCDWRDVEMDGVFFD